MDDAPANQTPGENFNKIDLSALEAFQFGTQWTGTGDDKKSGADQSSADRQRGPGGEGGPSRRDRRPPRRAGEPGGGASAEHGATEPPGYAREGRDRSGPRPPGRDFGPRTDRRPRSDFGGGERRFDRGGGGEGRFDRGGPRRPMGPPRPYVSPVFEITFYPDDQAFGALVKAMRASCRTYELFEIARLILGKSERCVVVFRRRRPEMMAPAGAPGGGMAAAPEAPASGGGLMHHLAISVPTGVPFETEEEAINHTLEHHLDQFFTTETVDAEPPKGSFQFVNRCPITKTLLGPPNYHRYVHIVQHHYTTHGIRMPFEKYKASIEVVRDAESVNQWLESMKKTTRYTYRGELPAGESGVFDSLEDGRNFLLRIGRDKLVRTADTARVSAKTVEAADQTEAFRAMSGAVDAQRRFPLDTANALRGRLRRENFNIFKRGSKGVTYVCSVRRKFRQPGQVFSDSIDRLIAFLDHNPMVNVVELTTRFLGFTPPPAPPPPPAAPPATAAASTGAPETSEPGSAPAAAPAPPAPEPEGPTPEQKAALNRLILDLRWLVTEGYVAEYSDGKLFAHPVMTPQAQAQHEKAEQHGEEPGGEVPTASSAEAEAAEPATDEAATEASVATSDLPPPPETAANANAGARDVEPAVRPTEPPPAT